MEPCVDVGAVLSLLVPCDNADLALGRCCFDGSGRLLGIRAAASTGGSRTAAQPGRGAVTGASAGTRLLLLNAGSQFEIGAGFCFEGDR